MAAIAMQVAVMAAVCEAPVGAQAAPRAATAAAIGAAMRTHRLVGIGEFHRLEQQHAVLQELLWSGHLPGEAFDIVVEFGNARYQEAVDRFIAGEGADVGEVQLAWRNTTIVGLWDAPMYESVFRTVRAVNATRSAGNQIRLLLGDPPIDWDSITKAAELAEWLERHSRNEFFTAVVEREVMSRGRRALLIAGGGHLARPPAELSATFARGGPNETGMLDHRYPGALYVIGPYSADEQSPARDALLRAAPVPSLHLLRGTVLGATVRAGRRLEQRWDALLYLGPPSAFAYSGASAASRAEPAYQTELARRRALLEEAERIRDATDQ